jgi:hypothetical protein
MSLLKIFKFNFMPQDNVLNNPSTRKYLLTAEDAGKLGIFANKTTQCTKKLDFSRFCR